MKENEPAEVGGLGKGGCCERQPSLGGVFNGCNYWLGNGLRRKQPSVGWLVVCAPGGGCFVVGTCEITIQVIVRKH